MQDERKTKVQLIAELTDLRRRETEYQALFENSPHPMWVYDKATLAVLAVNDAAVGHYGYSRAEFLRMTNQDLYLPEDVPLLLDIVRDLPGPYRTPGVWRQKQKDGALIDVEITTHDIAFDGKAARLVLANDITVRREAERIMRYQAALIDNVAEAIIATDEKLNIQVWNTAAEQIYVWRVDEVIGRPIDQIIPGEFPDTREELVRQQLERAGHWRGEITQHRKDRSPVHVLASTAQLRDSDGHLFGTITVNHDITARKEAEEALRQSEERFRRYFELGLIGMAITSPTQRILEVNDQICAILGYEREELLQKSWAELTYPDDLAADKAQFQSVLAGKIDGYSLDKRFIRQDGQVVDTTISVKCLRCADGSVDYFVALLQDITARKRAEQALRDSERRERARAAELQTLMDAVPAAVWIAHDQMSQIITGNRASYALLRLAPQRNVAFAALNDQGPIHFKVLQNGRELPRNDLPIEVSAATGVEIRDFEEDLMFDDGTVVHTLGNVMPLFDEQGRPRGAVGAFVDITERQQAEQALSESEEKFRSFVEQSSEGVVLLDEGGRVIEWNQTQERITGIPRVQAIHVPFWELQYRVLSPELRPARGPEFFREALLDAFRIGEVPLPGRQIEIEVQTPAGERRFIQQTAFPIKTAQGYRIGSIFRDVTERKQAEQALRDNQKRLLTLSRQLLHAHETERRAIARELHDDIGQALTAVKLDLQTAQRAADPAAVRARLDDSIAAVEHALQAVRHLSLDLRPSLLDDLGLAAALRWYIDRQAQRAGFTAEIKIETLPARPAPEIETICFRVAQEALTNIVRHAKARQVSVVLRQNSARLEMIIRDDGSGFDVYEAREQALRGASLGLLSMEERVVLGNGRIEIESAPGQGTAIHVWLPLAEKDAAR